MITDGITRIEGGQISGGNLPPGGLTNQVLVKKSNNAGDVGWADPVSSPLFDSNRPITRTSFPTNLNVGSTDLVSFLNAVFFPPPPYQELSINLNLSPSNVIYEYGTTANINLSTDISLNSASYANTLIYVSGGFNNVGTFASPTLGSNKNISNLNVVPDFSAVPSATDGFSVNFYAQVSGDNNGTPKLYTSNTQTIKFEAPFYYGTGIELTANQMKTVLTKAPIALRGSSKTFVYNTPILKTNLYFVYPESWGLLSSIVTSTNFVVTNLFATFATGLTLSDGSTATYRVYKSKNLTTCSNCNYIMNF
jgi:hypothetical protein